MEENSAKADANSTALFAGEAWFDPIEAGDPHGSMEWLRYALCSPFCLGWDSVAQP